MLTIQLLNDLAQINNFEIVQSKNYIANLPLKINLQVGDDQTGQRYMAMSASKMVLQFQLRDGTVLTKNASELFSPGDLSMWTSTLTATDTNNIVGSNFQVFLDVNGDSTLPDLSDATVLLSGMAYNVLSKITFDGEC